VSVARVSDITFAKHNFGQNRFKLGSNTLNETENLVYNSKTLQLTAALTLRNTTNSN